MHTHEYAYIVLAEGSQNNFFQKVFPQLIPDQEFLSEDAILLSKNDEPIDPTTFYETKLYFGWTP